MVMDLTPNEWNTIVHALRVAADKYRRDAEAFSTEPHLSHRMPLIESQASAATLLAERIEATTTR